MHRLAASCLLSLVFLAVPAVELHAQKEKDKKKKMDAPEVVDSAKLSGEFVGNLKSTPGTDRIFSLTVETKKLVATGKGGGNNSGANRIIQLQRQIANDQVQLQRARNLQERLRYQQRLLRDQQQLQQYIVQLSNGKGGVPAGYKVETVKQEVEFQASETARVRTMVLPEVFDDKGNVKKYTKEELNELKGKDKSAVGYESALEKLEVGMKVRVVLGPAPAKKEEKDKEKDKDELNAEKKMQVKQLVVLENAPPGPAPKGKKNK